MFEAVIVICSLVSPVICESRYMIVDASDHRQCAEVVAPLLRSWAQSTPDFVVTAIECTRNTEKHAARGGR